jgi:hypothetical protein
MTLPVPTLSYPILRWCLNSCDGDVELAAKVIDSYVVIAWLLTYHTLIEEETPQQFLEEAAAMWELAAEMMYRDVPGLTRGAVPDPPAVFGEITAVLREVDNMDDVEALILLGERILYQGNLLPGHTVFILEALRLQESTFINTVTQFWLSNRRSEMATMENWTASQNEEVWEDFEPAGLTDVSFEPSGPRMDVDDIATKTRYLKNPTCSMCRNDSETEDECGHSTCNICLDTLDLNATGQSKTPMEVRCGHAHSFHFECLDDLINGISEFSNLCPNCRGSICERRARQAIAAGSVVNDRVDAALAAEDSWNEESEGEEMIGAEEEDEMKDI